MRHSSSPAVTTALLALAIVLVPTAGLAQEAAPPPPIAIGPFGLWPSITIRSIGVDSNVFNEPENPKRDFTATLIPALQVVVRPPRTSLTITTSSDFVYFREYADGRHVNRSFGGSGEFDLTYVRPFATFA